MAVLWGTCNGLIVS